MKVATKEVNQMKDQAAVIAANLPVEYKTNQILPIEQEGLGDKLQMPVLNDLSGFKDDVNPMVGYNPSQVVPTEVVKYRHLELIS